MSPLDFLDQVRSLHFYTSLSVDYSYPRLYHVQDVQFHTETSHQCGMDKFELLLYLLDRLCFFYYHESRSHPHVVAYLSAAEWDQRTVGWFSLSTIILVEATLWLHEKEGWQSLLRGTEDGWRICTRDGSSAQ
jgi:hypothetical protein